MITSTLKGVFPEPKPTYRRNFIKENVSRIKQMQGLIPLSDPDMQRKRKDDRYKNVPTKIGVQSNAALHTKTKMNSKVGPDTQRPATNDKSRLDSRNKDISKIQVEKQRFLSRGMQTERLDDVSKLYESGVIKYASAGVRRSPKKDLKKFTPEQGDSAATVDELYEAADNLGLGDKTGHNYVKENIKNIKPPKVAKNDSVRNPNQPPPTYQLGVVPKYLKERKGYERVFETEPDCPPGHILLPEDERKETLRVLRQSYADRVQELNSLPVRSDTLKMKKRKMDIEEELKKIDEGIKVFQRPKVFVKINA